MQVRHKSFGEWGNAFRYFPDSGKVLVDWEAGPHAKASGSNHISNLVFVVPAETAPLTTQQLMALHGWEGSMWDFVMRIPDPDRPDFPRIYGHMQPTSELEGYRVYDPRDH